jgi:3',5'-cyclic-AMP phosphodiesterase
MQRREFLKTLAKGMAAGWACQRWPGAFPLAGEGAASPNFSIACLADPHLMDGHDKRPEAQALARAVAEIRALSPAPRLVLFAGDLAHDGNSEALALGEEILSKLTMPVLAVRGEGDGSPMKGEAGWRFFNHGRFCYTWEGVNLLGLDTVWQDQSHGPEFALGEAQLRWLSEVLPRLEPNTPLVVLSHAPLVPIYRPWGQWTRDSGPLLDRFASFKNVLSVHGHVHHGDLLAEQNIDIQKQKTAKRKLVHLALPATSWPLPCALTGTPPELRPGLGPRGCGWALLQQGGQTPQFRQVLWQA